MIIDGPDAVTTAVLEAMAQGDDPRLREITVSFARHDGARSLRTTQASHQVSMAVPPEGEMALTVEAPGLRTGSPAKARGPRARVS